MKSEGKAINGWIVRYGYEKKAHVVSIAKEVDSYGIVLTSSQNYLAVSEDEEQKVDIP